MSKELDEILELSKTYCGICQLLEKGYTIDEIAADLAIRHDDILKKANEMKLGIGFSKEKWNNVMRAIRNGRCKKHGLIYWYGLSELWPNEVGFNCPLCEMEEKGKFSERTKEIMRNGRY